MTPEPRARFFWILPLEIWIALALYYLIVIPFFSYVPIWDSQEYLEMYLFRQRDQVDLDTLLLTDNGHLGLGYFWPFWIGQILFPYQILSVQIINIAIGSLAIIAFGGIAFCNFGIIASRWEIGLLTVAFAIHPVFVAFAINESLDYGVLAYFLATIWLLYLGRFGWASFTGLSLIFSKEIGLLLYTLTLVYFFCFAVKGARPKSAWLLVVPYLGFAAYWFHRIYEHKSVFPWAVAWMKNQSLLDLYLPNPFKADFKMAALGPFFLEFQWIFTAIILGGILVGPLANRPSSAQSGLVGWVHKFNAPFRGLGFLLLGCLYLESRTLPFTNQRYVLPLYAMVLLVSFAALLQITARTWLRFGVLGAATVLLFFCNFWTLDPLSKKVVGTISFGCHDLLSIATVRPDAGNLNRDELVYNLQHTYIPCLLDQAFEEIHPTKNTTFVLQGDAWWIISRLDEKTFNRTECRSPLVITPRVRPVVDIIGTKEKPPTVYLLALPYLNNSRNLALLAPFYRIQKDWFVQRHGYELHIYEMTLAPVSNSNLPDEMKKSVACLPTWETRK